MGTPEFAVASLDKLSVAGHSILAVVTSPDRPAGRGQTNSQSEVKKYAVAKQLPVLQPEILNDPEFIKELKSLGADLAVVVAFRKLPESVWSIFPRGTINLHASLLPDYRGPAPIPWVIINGETETGLTTFFINRNIDTGNILLQEKVAIPSTWDAGMLHDEMMIRGAGLVLRTANGIESGLLKAIPQDHTGFIHHAPKIFPELCRINWSTQPASIHNHVRGLSPYPAAWTMLNGKKVKILKTEIDEFRMEGVLPGTIQSDGRSGIRVAASNGSILVLELQMEGKKRMAAKEFLAGFRDPLINFA